MYAIIADGGRQYKVQEGQQLEVDYRDVSAGDEVRFDKVLAIGSGAGMQLGSPTLAGALVTGKVVNIAQGPKLVVQKLRRRKNVRRRTGHRQLLINVQIQKIAGV